MSDIKMNEFKRKLINLQSELKAPKNQYNSFGKYSYRNAEDILTALKPLLKKYNLLLTISDEIVLVGDRYYIKATARITDADKDDELIVTGLAREVKERKGMDESQITGTASSYARKYALNGMFNIDDTKDADSDEYASKTAQKAKEKLDTTYASYYNGELPPPSEKQKALIRTLAFKKGISKEDIEKRISQLKTVEEASGAINRLKDD